MGITEGAANRIASSPRMVVTETANGGVCIQPRGTDSTNAEGNFDRYFRTEVAHLVHQILQTNYLENRHQVLKEAYRRRTTAEQVIASLIAQAVMKKVDEEYY